jgi:hypothetical protein
METNETPKNIIDNINDFLGVPLFGVTDTSASHPKSLPRKESVASFPYWFDPERVHEVIHLYCTGMPVNDIAHWIGLTPDDTNMIIDHYAPYL